VSQETHRGRYNRGYLTHIDSPDHAQMITFRLADALDDESDDRREVERCLDRGHGECWLRHPKVANIMVETLKFYDGDRYRLQDWVVMPNHVHVSYDEPEASLADIVHGWKSYTAHEAKDLLGLAHADSFWQRGYFDRYIRDRQHMWNVQRYILLNPVEAGLVDDLFEWPYSSIHDYGGEMQERFRRWFRDWKKRRGRKGA